MLRRTLLLVFASSLALWLAVCSLYGQGILPSFSGESLAGKRFTMPGAVHGHPAILVVCFTHASGPHCTEWSKRLNAEFRSEPALEIYTAIFLEDAPRVVRGVAKSAIRSGVAKEDYDRYLIVTEHEKDVKEAVHFQEPDDAYLVLLGPEGDFRGTSHGPISDEAVRHLREMVPGS